MTFEDKLMAYFDGMLDGKAEQKLLSEIQSDPQKQQIFEAHESLHGMMTDRTNPIGVPLKAEQHLAAKIPALGTAIPQLNVTDRGKAAVAGLRGGTATRYTLLKYAAVSGAALLIAGLGLYFGTSLFDSGSELSDALNSQAGTEMTEQTADAGAGDSFTDQGTSDILPDRDEVTGLRETNPSLDRTENTVHIGTADDAGTALLRERDASTDDAAQFAGDFSLSSESSIGSGTRNDLFRSQLMDALAAAINRRNVGEMPATGTLPSAFDDERIFPTLNTGHNTRVFLTGFTSALNRQSTRFSGQGVNTAFQQTYSVGIELQLTPALYVGVEGGTNEFPRLESTVQDIMTAQGEPNSSELVTRIGTPQMFYARLRVAYVLNPDDALKFGLSGMAGSAVEEFAPAVSIGPVSMYELNRILTGELGVYYTGMWVRPYDNVDAILASRNASTIGLVDLRLDPRTTFTSGIELRAGLRVTLW